MTLFEEIVNDYRKKSLITEDKVTDYIKKLIVRNVSEAFKPYLKTSVNDLPENFQQYFKNVEEHSFNVCSEKNFNLTQFFRLYFLNFFGIHHGKGPSMYTMGIARIAIEQLNMFNDDANHGKLSKLKQLVTFIANEPDKIPIQFNEDLNSLNYRKLEETVYPYYKKYIEDNKKDMEDVKEKSDYEIVPISSFKESSKYGDFTDWCVTQEQSHFNSYTTRGERFYFCLKEGFENVPRREGENCPLDEYGLSMISVLVDKDGEPVHITTRWNHAHNGEDNPYLRTAKQVQEIVGVNFYETFKPFTDEELEELRNNGDYQEDEETRYENYLEERDAHATQLWDGCEIMPAFNDDYVFNENDSYYVYDSNYDDSYPITWEEVNPEPIYVNVNEKIAILKTQYRKNYLIVYEYVSDRDRIDSVVVDSYEKITINGEGDLIIYVKDDKLSYICGNDFGESKDKIYFGDEDSIKIFVNKQIKESNQINSYEIPIEVIHDDEYKHSLFIITMGGNDVRTVVKCDVPENQMMFTVNENGIINAGLRSYYLDDNSSFSEEYEEGRIVDIEKNLDEIHYLVCVQTSENNPNCYNIISKGSKKKLVPFDFASYKFLNGNDNIVVRKQLSDKHKFDNAAFIFDYNTNSIVSNQHNDFAYFRGNSDEGIIIGGDTDDGKNITYCLLNNNDFRIEFGPFTNFDSYSIYGNKIIIKGFNNEGYTYIFDMNEFKPIKKFVNYGIDTSFKYNFKGYPYICFQELETNEVNLYFYPKLQIVERNVKNYRLNNHAIIVNKTDGTSSIIDSTTRKIILNDIEVCGTMGNVSYGNFIYGFKNNFVYIINPNNLNFYPTEYGIDATNAKNKFVDFNSLYLEFNMSDVNVRVKYTPSRNEEGCIEVSFNNSNRYELLKYCNSDIQNIVKNMFYPQQKVQVMNSFNEMINRMKKLVK